MALVMLPCDLPWWSNICKRLTLLQQTDDTYVILEIMQRIHDLCNISLDPDEDKRDTTIFDGLKNYLANDMDADECKHFKTVTLRNLAKRAQSLKAFRPPRGLSFSLQQQPDKIKLNYNLVAALLANAFFSTFPKRTEKTHPTLQDFNFTHFFRKLNENHQKVKFLSFIKYFDWLEERATAETKLKEECEKKAESGDGDGVSATAIDDDANNTIKISRKVFSGKQWLTIEDWLECALPLCSLEIKHEGRIERSHEDIVQTIFASSRLGGSFLSDGWSQECVEFALFPEMIAILLYVEALEDNEVIFVEDVRQIYRIMTDSNKRCFLEPLDKPRKISVCLMDAEDYSTYPVSQFEEDNILRELNKCLLAFRQNTNCPILPNNSTRSERRLNSSASMSSNPLRESKEKGSCTAQRRLSPIGESGRNSPKDITQIVIRQPSTSTKRSSYDSDRIENNIDKRRSWLAASPMGGSSSKDGSSIVPSVVTGPTASGRRGRFIVLGSSGECLPVNRRTMKRQLFASSSQTRTDSNSVYSSCNSSENDDDAQVDGEEKYYSARTSFDDFVETVDDDEFDKKYCGELDTVEKRFTFAEKLREALRHSECCTDSTDDSYAVDISISGSKTDGNEGIRIRRGGSRGFVLTEDSLDEEYFMESLNQEQNWLEKFRNKFSNGPILANNVKTDTNANITTDQKSKCSYDGNSTEFSSELEEVYEQFSKWLDDPIIKDNIKTLDPRDEAVLKFASSLLKRTLSESFVGVPLTEGCITSTCIPAEENSLQNYQNKQKNRQILNARSLSLEVAKHKHRLAAQLNNQANMTQILSTNTKATAATTTTPLLSAVNVNCANKSVSHHQPQSINKLLRKPPSLYWSITPIESQQIIHCDAYTVKISQIGKNRTGRDGVKPVATGNWGCGSTFQGDVQLKLVIQWMAASVSGLPILVYYTGGHEKLAKLDTVCRVLLDRKWTVGELAAATLEHAKDILDFDESNSAMHGKQPRCFFEKLIGI